MITSAFSTFFSKVLVLLTVSDYLVFLMDESTPSGITNYGNYRRRMIMMSCNQFMAMSVSPDYSTCLSISPSS